MQEEIVELKGSLPGLTSMVLAGVHGDEVCGVRALEKLLSELQIENGRVFFGYGNPRAIHENVRYVEANLNRMFKTAQDISDQDGRSYEYARAQFLKTYMDQSGALLDVHASFVPESRRFVICESNAQDIVSHLPFDLVVSGFDAIEPGGTDYYMNQRGTIGVCVECGYLGDATSVAIAEEAILAFLAARGHIGRSDRIHQDLTLRSHIRMKRIYLTKTDRFRLQKPFGDFERIAAGQLIAHDGDVDVVAEHDGVILFARNPGSIGEEAFLFGEYEDGLA